MMFYSDLQITVVISLLIAGVLIFLASRKRGEFVPYSPMSDDEFMADLPPGTNRERALRVREIVAKHAGLPPERIRPDTKIFEL